MRLYHTFLILGLSLLVAGCTIPIGNATLADIEAAYSQAKDAIAHAEAMGAEEHAPDLLRLARNRLQTVRENQQGAPSRDVLGQYRYVRTLAQRAATQSVRQRVQQVSDRLDQQSSPPSSASSDTQVKSQLKTVRERLDQLSDRIDERNRDADPSRETRRRLSNLEDTVTRIGSLNEKLGRLGDRLAEATSEELPELRDRVRENTRRLNALCDGISELRSETDESASRPGPAYDTDAEGLVAYWSFDEPAPEGFREDRGRIKSRTLGAGIRSGGVFGERKLWLSGERDFLAVSHNSRLNPGGPDGFTVATWFHTDSLGKTAHLLNKWDPESETGWYLSVSPADVSFVMKGGTEPVRTYAGGSPVDGNWHHLAATFDPEANVVRLYRNGQKVDREPAAGSVTSEGFLALGGFAHKNKNYFTGSLDEVRIYGRTLPDSDIRALAERTPRIPNVCSTRTASESFAVRSVAKPDTEPDTTVPQGILAHWPLEDTGTTVTDTVGQLDGERVGATLSGKGVRGKSYEFDGRDDRVRIPDDSVLDRTRSFTFSAWVRPSERKRQYVLDRGPTPSPYSMFMTEDGDVVFSLSTDEGYNQIRSVGYELDRWYHLVGTYDGEVMKLYRNGKLVSSVRVDGTVHSNDRPLVIGARSGSKGFFRGRIDEVKFHATALRPGDVLSEYERLRQPED